MLTVTLLVSLFFGVPAVLLFYVHLMNFLTGKTTNERFAAGPKQASESASMSDISEFITQSGEEAGTARRKRSVIYNCS
jgi:hypothetical protein